MTHHRRDWSTSEVQYLIKHSEEGAPAIASALDRSVKSVKDAASRYRISLRRPGECRGLLLTQPRRTSWRDRGRLREAVVLEGFDLAEAISRIRAEKAAPLCPKCGLRAATRRTTGYCDICHYNALADKHREQPAIDKARRDYRACKKAAGRRVECAECHQEYSPRKDEEGRKSDRNLCPECRGGESS